MSVGELWVEHPFFPWLMIILALWVGFSTAVMSRNWFRIRKLERHNKLLQEMTVEGVGNLAGQVRTIQNRYANRPVECEEERTSEFCSGETGIRSEEPAPTAIEEADENRDHITVTEYEDQERESVRST